MKHLETYIKYIRYELNLSAHTVSSYVRDLSQFARFLAGKSADSSEGIDLLMATRADIRAWMVELSKERMQPRSIRRKAQALRSFYRWAMVVGLTADNPAADLHLAKPAKRLPQYVRDTDMERILDATEPEPDDFVAVRNHLIIDLLYQTGIRRAELISLRDADVDTAARRIKVMGKRAKERIVPIGDDLAAHIDTYRALRDDLAGGPTEAFFTRPTGLSLYPSLVYKIVHEALASAAVKQRSPHTLRHSFASAMLNNGAELNSVKTLLGHASLAATQVYTHITISELQQNYQLAHPRASKTKG